MGGEGGGGYGSLITTTGHSSLTAHQRANNKQGGRLNDTEARRSSASHIHLLSPAPSATVAQCEDVRGVEMCRLESACMAKDYTHT